MVHTLWKERNDPMQRKDYTKKTISLHVFARFEHGEADNLNFKNM